MMLILSGLAATTVIVSALARDHELPPVELPKAAASRLGDSSSAEIVVTLRVGADSRPEVFVEGTKLARGMAELGDRLRASGAQVMTLRADGDVRWEDSVAAMGLASAEGISVSAAVER